MDIGSTITMSKPVTFLEKLYVFVALSLTIPLFFILLGYTSLFYPYTEAASTLSKAFKADLLFLMALVSLGVWGCIHALCRFSKKERPPLLFLTILRQVFVYLCYFSFCLGANRFVVAGICVVGLGVSILAAAKKADIEVWKHRRKN